MFEECRAVSGGSGQTSHEQAGHGFLWQHTAPEPMGRGGACATRAPGPAARWQFQCCKAAWATRNRSRLDGGEELRKRDETGRKSIAMNIGA